MNSIDSSVENVIDWAYLKGIMKHSDPKGQMLKTVEEIGELASAIGEEDKEKIIDGIGDVMVTLIIQCEMQKVSLKKCIETAYNEIKDRKGEMKGSFFVKDE